jgi:hypothetical protein
MNEQTGVREDYDDLGRRLRDGVARLVADRERRRRRARALGIAAAALACLCGIAIASATFVGSPAPRSVQDDIAAVDAGMPAGLRMSPDVHNARSVAATGRSTLWMADLAGAGRCLELTTTYYPNVRAPGCSTGTALALGPISATIPNDETSDPAAPVVIAGHVEPTAAVSLEIALGDGRKLPVPFGAQRFYVIDLTGADAADARARGLTLVAADRNGAEVARVTVPADWDAGSADVEATTTADVTTRSDSSDLTKVLGIDGVLRDPKPASLQIVYDADTTVDIPLAADGSFHYDVPQNRRRAFMTPRHLVGRDATGRIVVERQVAAVAFWRGQER